MRGSDGLKGDDGKVPGFDEPAISAATSGAKTTSEGDEPMNPRPALDQLGLSTGKKARLHRILHEHGLRNGTAIFLPYDQGLEHGPRDFFANPAASDPKVAIHVG
jgi:hypothetical protein